MTTSPNLCFEANRPSEFVHMANPLGFTFPSSQVVVQTPLQENEKLFERKARLLTEIAAIEQSIPLSDFLDPARDQLPSSVTDIPCQVKLLSSIRKSPPKPLAIRECGQILADAIIQMGQSPAPFPLHIPRPPPRCDAIVKHARVFFAQLKDTRDARAGLHTAFGVIPHVDTQAKPPPPEPPAEDDQSSSKRVHPFFPDVQGLGPLLGHMKQQLGEFPNFVRNPPDDAEAEELRLAAEPDCLRKHLLEICGSSSDDEFDPDAALDVMPPAAYQHPMPARPM
jgi:hypothetical protein